ncbi:hypothetical protein G3465_12340 [Shewanella baltica]|uniref:hypothetical protein n=1 Tax=Shewanella baltica TaxID=62322 RepID=UPI00217CE0A9|nr:hypothetical protein [Shewanella baltica]MCS6153683.1 hypothetical protein [Shewanella baltica]
MSYDSNSDIDNLLKWLKGLALVGVLAATIIITLYFVYTWGPISSNQNDWAALGTLFSGVFSFLGAIGTVGVMLLGIKQFKVQQKQIEEQKTRQDNFEAKQQEKWDKENEMLSFQKYQMHFEQFERHLMNFQNKNGDILQFHSPLSLYKKVFKKNNYQNVHYIVNVNENVNNEDTIIDELAIEYNNLVNDINKINDIREMFSVITRTQSLLKLIEANYVNEWNAARFKINDLEYEFDFGLFSILTLFYYFKHSINLICEFAGRDINTSLKSVSAASIAKLIYLYEYQNNDNSNLSLTTPFPWMHQLLKVLLWLNENENDTYPLTIKNASISACLSHKLNAFSKQNSVTKLINDIENNLLKNTHIKLSDFQIKELTNLLDNLKVAVNIYI